MILFNGWLEHFRTRYNVRFRTISGGAAAIDVDTVDDWKKRLPKIIEGYDPKDVYNYDETGLFFKLMPDRSLVINKNDCVGGKRSIKRFIVLLCANWDGSNKVKPVVIDKAAKHRCFKNLDMSKLPVTWCSNRTAWMNCSLFTKWLHELDTKMQKQNRRILPGQYNSNFTTNGSGSYLSFQSPLSTAASDVAICWINFAWKSITETTLRETFKRAGFEIGVDLLNLTTIQTVSLLEDPSVDQNVLFNELNKVLKHLTIGGEIMAADVFVNVDKHVPSYNEWNDASEKILALDIMPNEEGTHDEDSIIEQPSSLSEAIKLVRRLQLLSMGQHPELHPLLSQLQSKLVDVFLDLKVSKQRSIRDFFKSA